MVKWENVELGKQADIYRGGSPRPIQTYLTQRNDGINWIKIGDVAPNAKYINATEERIIPEGATYSRHVSKGDFILSNSMSFGRPYILRIDGCIHDGWLTIQNYQKNFDTDFLYYLLGSEIIFEQYASMAAGSSVKNLTKEKVSKVVVYKPPLPEQRRIAAVLSDTDELIAMLEKLIAKKRAIKQGAMQELLTGKRRLPGFSEEWGEQLMSNCLVFEVGYPFKSELFNQNNVGLRLIKNRDLKSNDQVYFTTEEYDPTYIVKNGDVLIGMDGDFIPCLWNKGMALLNQRVGRIKTINIDIGFVYYVLMKPLEELQNGTGATTVKHLSHTNVELLQIYIPPTIEEQTAIASILSDMDAEIDALLAKLNKLRNIKQGMMSELLTGRIRLSEQVAVAVPSVKIVQFPKPQKSRKKHNQAIEDAVILGVITELYATEQQPLAPFYAQKLPYLFHRHIEGVAKGYYKLPAGPYNPSYKYRTALPIALKNKYVVGHKASFMGHEYISLTVGEEILEAKRYFTQWHGEKPLEWLKQFQDLQNRRNELELLTTVDMAMVELQRENKPINLFSVKELIQKSLIWKDKLKRSIFSDENIIRAIKWSNDLFGQGTSQNE